VTRGTARLPIGVTIDGVTGCLRRAICGTESGRFSWPFPYSLIVRS